MVDAGVTDAFIAYMVEHLMRHFFDPIELIPTMEDVKDVTGAPMGRVKRW